MATTAHPARPLVRDLPSAALVALATVLAYCAIAAGVFFAVGAATSSFVTDVPVTIGPEAPAYMAVVLPCVEGWSIDDSSCGPAAPASEWRGGAGLPVSQTGGFVAGSDGASWITGVLAAAGTWGGLLTAGVVALVLVPALRNTAACRPFAPRNARRLAVASALTAVGWILATVGPFVAAQQIVSIIEGSGESGASGISPVPTGWLVPSLHIVWWPLLVAALLAVLAVATRAGTRLADDSDGLV